MTKHETTQKTLYATFAALMVLLVATVAAAYLPLGPFNIALAMAIGITKALLVILIFMEARSSDRLVWVFIAAAVTWLLILIGGTAQEVLTRGWY